MTSPVPTGDIESDTTPRKTWFLRYEELFVVWIIALIEILFHTTVFIVYGNDEIIPFGLKVGYVWLLSHGLYFSCLVLWFIFVRQFYLWSNIVSLEHDVDQERLDEKLKLDTKDKKKQNPKNKCRHKAEEVELDIYDVGCGRSK